MDKFIFLFLFIFFNQHFAQSWSFKSGMRGLEIQGIHFTDPVEESIGGELGYTWNSRIDIKLKYLISEYDFQGQIMDGHRFVPQFECYVLKYHSDWPFLLSIFTAYHQDSFTHQTLGTDYKLTGNGWSLGARIFGDFFPAGKLRLMPVIEYRFLSVKYKLRQQPADQDLGTDNFNLLKLSIIMGRKFTGDVNIYMEPAIHFGKKQSGYQITLGLLLPFIGDDDE